MKDDQEYVIECLSRYTGAWYFCSRLHGLSRAVEWAAAFRIVKNEPARVRLA